MLVCEHHQLVVSSCRSLVTMKLTWPAGAEGGDMWMYISVAEVSARATYRGEPVGVAKKSSCIPAA